LAIWFEALSNRRLVLLQWRSSTTHRL
jgi:hypothetical protein